MSRQPQNAAFAETSFLQGANAAYIEEMQAQYRANPGSVSDEWRLFFQSLNEESAKAGRSDSDNIGGNGNGQGPSWGAPTRRNAAGRRAGCGTDRRLWRQ